MKLINRYENFDELTNTMINEFVEKIIIHERDRKGSQTLKQKIEIYFNFIGNYEPPKEELSKEERLKLEDEERKNNERKDKLYQNYLKRKASGTQQEYEKRYKAWLNAAPVSATTALASLNNGVHSGLVRWQTKISPFCIL